MYTVKLDFHNWGGHVNYVRAWLFMECTFFFNWIGNSVLFLLISYLAKFKSVSKNEEIMEMDDNVWNDKNTDDFLRYLKFEYFVLNFIMTFTSSAVMFGFSHFNGLHIFGDTTV